MLSYLLIFSILILHTIAQNPQSQNNGQQQQQPVRQQYQISPQIAAKLQQQHLQQLQQQHAHAQQNSDNRPHHHSYPPPQSQPIPASRQSIPTPSKSQTQSSTPPKYVSRNSIPDEGKNRFNTIKQNPIRQQQRPQDERSKEDEEVEDYYEDDGPDKLTLLLGKSKFSCPGGKDGYYADEGLNCEIFHYCQDGKKHSWMCPESMHFHQVHLICMPPSQDNICTKSKNYHFVNEYLYRPINEKEAASTNTSLRYADRYYPQGYTPGMPIHELEEQTPYQPRPPIKFPNHNHQNLYYNNPESINIPLNQRRPINSNKQNQRESNEYYDE